MLPWCQSLQKIFVQWLAEGRFCCSPCQCCQRHFPQCSGLQPDLAATKQRKPTKEVLTPSWKIIRNRLKGSSKGGNDFFAHCRKGGRDAWTLNNDHSEHRSSLYIRLCTATHANETGSIDLLEHPQCIVWKLLKTSRLNFMILAFSTNFCPIKTDLSGNTVWPQALGFQKLAKMDHFWHF